MKTIWKYPIAETIEMPIGSRIIKVDYDPMGELCLWAIVDPKKDEIIERQFKIMGTGFPYNEKEWMYIDTVFENPFVWHIFERKVGI